MKISFCSAFALLCLSAAGVTTNYVRTTATDWSKPESFTTDATDGQVAATVCPGGDDVVILPKNCSYSFTAGTDSFNVFANVKQVNYIKDGSATLTIDVPATVAEEVDLNCSVFPLVFDNYAHPSCQIVKTGKGTLHLMGEGRHFRSNNSWDYYCDIDVQEGSLKFQNEIASASAATYIGSLNVEEGAYFYLAGGALKTRFETATRSLSGGGVITNNHSFAANFNMMLIDTAKAGEFSGDFHGTLTKQLSGPIRLSGTGTWTGRNPTIYTATANFDYKTWGVTEVPVIGKRGYPSPLGSQNISIGMGNGGVLRYDGTGEETDKIFQFSPNTADKKFPSVIDAGHTGGIIFKNVGSMYGAPYWEGTGAHTHRVVLTGSNTVPCRVQLKVRHASPACSLHILKRGMGTWVFEGPATNSTNGGGITIENGTLQYASIAQKGCTSALGTATNTTRFVENTTLADIAANVPYAITLGGTNENEKGVLEYTGTGCGVCTTRPIVLQGRGMLSNSGEGKLWLGDVTVRDEGAKTVLHLGGSNTDENTLADLTNGVGSIELVKEGSGTWRTVCNFDVDSIEVKGGTLIVDHEPDYRWFRLTCKATLGGMPQFQELALFDADGVRRNIGMKYNQPPVTTNVNNILQHEFYTRNVYVGGYCNLQPNEVSYGADEDRIFIWRSAGKITELWPRGNQYRGLDNLFDGGWNAEESAGLLTSIGWYDNCYREFGANPVIDNPNSWIPLVMRVADGTPRITSFDAMSPGGVATNTEVTKWSLEGSADGYNWKTLANYSNDDETSHHGGKALWYSDWSSFSNGTNPNRKDKGFQFDGYVTDDFIEPDWANLPVKVSAGATLRINGTPVTIANLTLDASGEDAKIEGISLAESGRIDIAGFRNDVALTYLAADVSDVVNADNLSRWDVSFDGVPSCSYKVGVKNGKIRVYSVGFMINIK